MFNLNDKHTEKTVDYRCSSCRKRSLFIVDKTTIDEDKNTCKATCVRCGKVKSVPYIIINAW